jgi:predicted permease
LITDFLQDLRHALRGLRRAPGFSFTVIATLALGIGANTAIFSLTDAVLFRPFPVREPDRLVALYGTEAGKYTSISYPDFVDYRDGSAVFSGAAAYLRATQGVELAGRTELVAGEMVTPSYFPVLGLEMSLGRGFAAGEDTAQVVVLGHGLWVRAFGADPGVLGRTVRISGAPFQVVGVAPRGFRGVILDWGQPPDFWMPIGTTERVVRAFRSRPILRERDARGFLVLARLRPGATLAQARAEVATRAALLERDYPATNRGSAVVALPAREARFWPAYRKPIVVFVGLLVGVAVLILVLACANVANLMLARAAGRRREIAIRLALGAGRSRLLRQLAAESLLLAALGVVPGIAIALGATVVFTRFPMPFPVRLALDLGWSGRMFALAAALSVATTVGFGALPGLELWRFRVRDALSDRSGGAMRGGLRRWLVAVEIALCAVLLVGAGLFIRTLRTAARVPTGYRTNDVLLLSVSFNAMEHRYDERRASSFYREAMRRVGGIPGVRSATWGGDVPLAIRRLLVAFVPGEHAPARDEEWLRGECNIVGPRYFETLGIEVLRGRDFTERDGEDAVVGAAILNETAARRYWPGENPVGKRITVRGRARTLYEIVGVARDVRQRTLWDDPPPYIYLPVLQRYFPELMLHVRTAGDPMSLAPAVRAAITSLDPDLPVFDVAPLSNQVAAALAAQRTAAALLGVSGVLAVVLAALGVYGVTSYSVARRRQEIGIRMALGAERRAIFRLVLREGMVLAGAGAALGLCSALLASRLVEAYLHGVGARDTATFAAVPVLLGAVALAACWIPCRRATRIDPMAALRQE